MGELREFFPVILGIVVGVIGARIPTPRVRYAVMAALAVVLGAAWTITVGEFAESPAFVLVDIGLVALGAALAYGAATLAARRSARTL